MTKRATGKQPPAWEDVLAAAEIEPARPGDVERGFAIYHPSSFGLDEIRVLARADQIINGIGASMMMHGDIEYLPSIKTATNWVRGIATMIYQNLESGS